MQGAAKKILHFRTHHKKTCQKFISVFLGVFQRGRKKGEWEGGGGGGGERGDCMSGI